MFCCGEARSRPTLPLQVAPGWPSKPTAADFSEDVAYYLPDSLDIKKCSGAGYDEKLLWRICCLRAFRPTRRFLQFGEPLGSLFLLQPEVSPSDWSAWGDDR